MSTLLIQYLSDLKVAPQKKWGNLEIDPIEVGGFCLILTCEIEIKLHQQNQLRLCECDSPRERLRQRVWCAIADGTLRERYL
jgi:hypothetical protein